MANIDQSQRSGFLKTILIFFIISFSNFSKTTLSYRLVLLRISWMNSARMRCVFRSDSLRLASSIRKRRELISSVGMPMVAVTQRLSRSRMILRLTQQLQWIVFIMTATMSCSSKEMLPMRYPMLTYVISSICLVTSLKKKWFSSLPTQGRAFRQRFIWRLTGHSTDLVGLMLLLLLLSSGSIIYYM